MKRTIFLSVFFMLIVGVIHAQYQTVWQIGENDGSGREFGFYNENETAYSKAYKGQAVLFEVGVDKVSDIPFFFPGPNDAWAKSSQHHFILRFMFDQLPENTSAKLRINFAEVHPTAAFLEISMNGLKKRVRAPRGRNQNYLSEKTTNSSNLFVETEIPSEYLKKGENIIIITSVSGSWVAFDNILFSTDKVASLAKAGDGKGSTISFLDNAEVLAAITHNENKEKCRPANFNIINWTSKQQSVTLKVGDFSQKVKLDKGINSLSVKLPEGKLGSEISAEIITSSGIAGKASAKVPPVKDWQVNFVQHTHTDIGYTRPQHEILSEHMRIIDYALDYCDLTDNMPDDAKFRWTCETAWSVSEYLRTRPKEQVDRLKNRIREGRIEVTAMYFNYDEMPGEQELAYSLYPLKTFKDEGIKVQIAMQNDVNGIAWNFSDFFPDLGVKYLIMGTHGHKALISFDKPTAFWWESPSGKKMLTFRAEHYMYGNFMQIEKDDFEAFEAKVFEYLQSLEQKDYPHNITSIQFSGYYTDNSPPSTAACEHIRKWNEKYISPKLRLAVASEFMEVIEKQYGNQLPTYRAAWPDWWTDGFGSAARELSMMRYAQADIISNQISLSMAKILGTDIPKTIYGEIDEANKALLFYGEHTFGFHESVRQPFHAESMQQQNHKAAYAWESYRRTRPIGETALGLLQNYIPRKKENGCIAVFNPLNWENSTFTIIYADHEVIPRNKKVVIKDENGVEAKMQQIRSYADATYWALWVDKIPALGAKYYTINIEKGEPKAIVSHNNVVQVIENDWYRIKLNTEKGVVTEWFDKELNKNLISQDAKWQMGELIYEIDQDRRGALDRFQPGNFKRVSPDEVKYEGFVEGNIWDTYKFKGTTSAGEGKDNFTFELQLFKTCKQVNFAYKLNKKLVVDPEAVYVSFPFELEQGKIFFDVPGGTIEAVKEQIPGSTNDWNVVQNFASVRNYSGQIVLGSKEIPLMQFGNINLGRFKAGALPETNHIFTWPMNNYWVTNFDAFQFGEFEWSYYLTSSGNPSIENATKFSWTNRIPLQNRVFPAGVDNNRSILKESVLSLSPSNILLINMAPVEGEDAILLQLREIGGKDSGIDISSAYRKNLKMVECNMFGEELPAKDNIRIKAWENKFVKVKF